MLSVSQAYRLVAQEDSHKDLSQLSLNTDNMTFVAERRNYGLYNSQRRFSPNIASNFHRPTAGSNYSFRPIISQNNGPKRPSKLGANYFCTHCKVQGHNIDRCFQIHGFPPGFKEFKDRKQNSAATIVISQTFDIEQASSLQPMQVQHNDSQPGALTDEQYSQLLELLKDVLHVPEFHFYLISAHKLCKDLSCKIIFSDTQCLLQVYSQKEHMILLGNLTDGLYTASHQPCSTAHFTNKNSCTAFVSRRSDEVQL